MLFRRTLSFVLMVCMLITMLPQVPLLARAEEITPTETTVTAPATELAPVSTEESTETIAVEETQTVTPTPVNSSGTENGYSYTVDEAAGIATVTGYTGTETELTIPNTLGGYPVAAIGRDAFSYNSALTKVTLPDSLCSIGEYAFAQCEALVSIVIPDSVTSIGRYAFQFCTALQEVTLSKSLTSLDSVFTSCWNLKSIVIPEGITSLNGTFTECSQLKNVTLPSTLTSLEYAFAGCALESIMIPEGVTNINSTFRGCSLLKNVTLPSTLTDMGGAFSGCAIESIVLPEGLTSIDRSAFSECSALTSISIPNSVTRIEAWAFYNCDALTTVILPDSITAIGEKAFYECGGLTSIHLSANLQTIGERAFESCPSLASITIPGKVTGIGLCAFASCTGLTSVVIESGVTATGSHMFNGCSALTSVTLPDTLTTIDQYTFNGCRALEKIQIPGSVNTIRYNAFSYCAFPEFAFPENVTTLEGSILFNCKALTKVTLPKGITSISSQFFGGCTALTGVVIPETVTVIGSSAFFGCTALTEIALPDSVTSIEGSAFSGCNGLTNVTLPENVTSIGGNAFSGCANLESITMGNNVATMGKYAFSECPRLTSVTLSSALDSIGESAFEACTGLSEIIIPEGVKAIGKYAFENCTGLTKATLPSTLESIAHSAFLCCSKLQNINLPDGLTELSSSVFGSCTALTSISLPDSIATMDTGVFSGCTGLKEVKLPQGLTALPNSTFYNCSSLSSVEIPASVTTIGSDVFYNCDALTAIGLPENLTSIGFRAFGNCSGITEMTLPDSVTSLGGSLFLSCDNLEKITLPSGLTDIASHMFAQCISLKEIVIPEGVTRIQYYAFNNCRSLASISLPSTLTQISDHAFLNCGYLTELKLPEGITTISYNAFQNCSRLESINLPDSITSLGAYAFQNCIALTSATIPSGVKTLSEYAFQGCTGLTAVTIQEGLTTIGSRAFYGCTSLSKVNIPESLTQINSLVFYNCSTLTEIRIPNSVTSIGGNVFQNCTNLTIFGYPGSAAETYAKDYDIPFVTISDTEVRVTMEVLDPEGTALTSGYQVQWYAGEELLGTGDAISLPDPEQEYFYQILLEEDLSYQYRQPGLSTVSLEGKEVTLRHTLQPLALVAVTGKLTAGDSVSPIGGSIAVTQTFNEAYPRESSISVGEDGSFHAELLAVPSLLTFHAEGFRDRVLSLNLTGKTGSCDVGTIPMTRLPSNKITLTLKLTEAAEPGATASDSVITSFDGLTFAVTNVTQSKTITGFALQYPYLLLDDGQARGGDTLKISVSDEKQEMITQELTITLDAQANGSGTVTFLENGGFAIDRLTGAGDNTLMLFDSTGKLLCSERASSVYESPRLPAGSYTLVILKKTDLLSSVPTLASLEQYRISAGTDYVKRSVTVQNGIITQLGTIAVPALQESKLSYTKSDATDFTASTYSTFAGKYVMLRAAYEIRDGYSTSGQQVIFQLPEGLSAAKGSVSVDSRSVPFTVQGNQVIVPVNKSKAVVRLYLYGNTTGNFSILASLGFTMGGSTVIQPLGSVDLELFAAQFGLPKKTASDSLVLSGIAIPDSTLTIFDGDTPIGTATSNAAGSWSAAITMENPYDYGYHAISVSANSAALGGSFTSDSQILTYDADHISVSKVTMYNTGDNGANVTVFDFQNPGKTPSYRFWPGRYPDFTFVVEFTGGDGSPIQSVQVITTDTNGDRTFIDCTYDSRKNVWIGTHKYKTSGEAPVGVEVDVVRKPVEEVVLDMTIVSDINRITQEADSEFEKMEQEAAAEAEKNLPDYDAMTLDQLIIETGNLLTQTELLINEGEQIWQDIDSNAGITYRQTENTTSISTTDMTYTTSNSTAEGMTAESLTAAGYTKVPTSDGSPVYLKTDGTSVSLVDLGNNTALESMVMPISEGSGSSGDSYGQQVMDNLGNVQSIFGTTNDFVGLFQESEDVLRGNYRDLLRADKMLDKHLEKMYDKLQDMTDSGASYDELDDYKNRIRDVQKLRGDLKGRMNNLKARSAEGAKLGKLGKGLGVAGTVLSGFSLFDAFKKMKALKDKYDNLSRTCSANGDYQNMKDMMDELDKQMKITSGLFLVGSGACLFLSGPVAPLMYGLALTALQAWVDQNLGSKYDAMDSQLNNMDCDDDGQPDLDQPGISDTGKQPAHVVIDPSGYVYEAVPSNRLEGVKAEIYYVGYALDDFGIPKEEAEEIFWDAENYDQVNPLYTDASGSYRWDVPFGQWLVKYSKEGYHDTDSRKDPAANEAGYLPVPPPQVEVNTAMVSKAAPVVNSVNVYNDEVQILFSQYMDLTSVNTSNVTVTMGGKAVSGRIEPVNAEYNYEGTVQYASIFRFVPKDALSGQAAVSVANTVNYAGTKQASPFSQTKAVVVRPTGISAGSMTVAYNGKGTFDIQILPAEAGANRTLTVDILAPSIVTAANQTLRTDANGKATLTLNGQLPGYSDITLSLDGTDLSTTVQAHVTMGTVPQSTCAKVEASIPNGATVKSGTQLTLTTATEGASIYYTLDGTCPCVVDSPSRILYTGPITLTEDTFLIAYAVKSGMKDSATAGFSYTVTAEPTVTRIAGASRYLTAITAADTLKDILSVDKFNSVIIASGTNFADALAGSYLAAVKSAPILLSTKKSDADNLTYIQENLAGGGTVYILGGTSAVSDSIENLLKNANIQVKRLAGKDRYQTNLLILEEAGFTGGEVLVAIGNNFADSLSASATGKPILLVGPKWDMISLDYVNYLSGKDCNFTIIGGEGAVKAAIETDLKNYGEVRRIFGSNRLQTSVKVAEAYFASPSAAVLACSTNFPDGLCGGPVAYALGAPLLLVNVNKEATPAAYVEANSIKTGYIMGGDAVVSDASVQAIFGSIS